MSENTVSTRQAEEQAGKRRQARLDSGTMKDLDALLIKPLRSAGEAKEQQDGGMPQKQARHTGGGVKEQELQAVAQDSASEPAREGSNSALNGPVGIDIGTTHITVAQNNCKSMKTFRQLNAFFCLPYTKMLKKTLEKDGVDFFVKNSQIYIFGSAAETFAAMHGSMLRKPVEGGLLNPKEDDSIEVIKAIIDAAIRKTTRDSATICFTVPGEPFDRPVSTMFHQSVIRMHLQSLGYTPIPVNAAMSIILSELADNNFTGIGVSIGGGMCNVCFSYLSVPVITFSIRKGGDFIDAMVGSAVGEPTGKIRAVKENGFDLGAEPANKIETGLHIFYDDLFASLVQGMAGVFGASDKIPRMAAGIPLVLGGGTVAPRGCREKFEKALQGVSLPFSIAEVRMAGNPLYATARGALRMALEEGNL